MPSIVQLRYVTALQRTGHFGRAAAACGVSQPTLSAQIAKAEAELGVVLFDRRAKPVRATEEGARLIELARDVLQAHDRLLATAEGAQEVAGPFELGIIPTLAPYVLPWFLGPFTARYPQVELTVVERTTEAIVRGIGARRLDAGLLATPLGEPGLDEAVVFYDPFYGYAHPDSPLLARDELDRSDLERSDLWLLADGHCFRDQMVDICGIPRGAIFPSVSFEAGSFETLRQLIDATGGCTLVPETFARTLDRTARLAQLRPFADPVPVREVGVVSHRASWKTPIRDAIVATLREVAPRSLPREPAIHDVRPVRS
jgi:LysR family hydrogen peroxide-inducible transcriptional activator